MADFPKIMLAFQISKTVVFECNYDRISNNKTMHFSTSAAQFNKPKTDFCRCGQAQDDLLPKFSPAWNFYKKWDLLHLKKLTKKQYDDLCRDLTMMKVFYNYVEEDGSNWSNIPFSALKALSKNTVKKINPETAKNCDFGTKNKRAYTVRSACFIKNGKNQWAIFYGPKADCEEAMNEWCAGWPIHGKLGNFKTIEAATKRAEILAKNTFRKDDPNTTFKILNATEWLKSPVRR